MQAQYRKFYQGEYVIYTTNRVRGVVEQKRDWIPNTINNINTGHAVVFGNGLSRTNHTVPFELFKQHRGGLHATKKVTTYGCNAFFRDADPHFLIVNNPIIANEVVKAGYEKNNIVLTTVKNVLLYPDKFHLIPFDQNFCAGATALYLAAFDGHRKIYFLGFDGQDSPDFNNNVYAGTNGYAAKTAHVDSVRWEEQIKEIFDAYPGSEFIRVMPSVSTPIPELWKYASNFKQIEWRQFISEIDLGTT